jgi:hypothetical protein
MLYSPKKIMVELRPAYIQAIPMPVQTVSRNGKQLRAGFSSRVAMRRDCLIR